MNNRWDASKKMISYGISLASLITLLLFCTALLYQKLSLPLILLFNSAIGCCFLICLFLLNKFYRDAFLANQKSKLLETQLKVIVESMPESICIFDKNAKLILLNIRFIQTIQKAFGKNPTLGMRLEEVISNLDDSMKQDILENWQKVFHGEETVKRRLISGETFEICSSSISNERNEITGTIHLIRNISARITQEKTLALLNQKLFTEMEGMDLYNKKMELLIELGDTFQACSSIEEIADATASYGEKILDFTQGILYTAHSNYHLEIIRSWGQHRSIKHLPIDLDQCWALKQRRPFQVKNPAKDLLCDHLKQQSNSTLSPSICRPLIINNKILGLLYLKLNSKKLTKQQKHLISAVAEATALALSNAELREQLVDQSIHDSLTGLYNRRYLEEFLDKLLHQAKRKQIPVCIVMFDFDQFKIFNDRYGHEAGDIVLKEISKTFQNTIRAGDIACRYGGEEFMWLMNNCSLEFAFNRAEELRHKLSKVSIIYASRQLDPITVSFGIAIHPTDGTTPNDLIDAADRALYAAKNTGRNKVMTYAHFISENMNK